MKMGKGRGETMMKKKWIIWAAAALIVALVVLAAFLIVNMFIDNNKKCGDFPLRHTFYYLCFILIQLLFII